MSQADEFAYFVVDWLATNPVAYNNALPLKGQEITCIDASATVGVASNISE